MQMSVVRHPERIGADARLSMREHRSSDLVRVWPQAIYPARSYTCPFMVTNLTDRYRVCLAQQPTCHTPPQQLCPVQSGYVWPKTVPDASQ